MASYLKQTIGSKEYLEYFTNTFYVCHVYLFVIVFVTATRKQPRCRRLKTVFMNIMLVELVTS